MYIEISIYNDLTKQINWIVYNVRYHFVHDQSTLLISSTDNSSIVYWCPLISTAIEHFCIGLESLQHGLQSLTLSNCKITPKGQYMYMYVNRRMNDYMTHCIIGNKMAFFCFFSWCNVGSIHEEESRSSL